MRSPELLLSGCRPFAIGKMSAKNFAHPAMLPLVDTPKPFANSRSPPRSRSTLQRAKRPSAWSHQASEVPIAECPSSPAPLSPLHRIIGGKFPLNRSTCTMERSSRVRAV